MELEFLSCPTCRDITMVEVPPCPDAHGENCPDRACTVCGTALSLDGVLLSSPDYRIEVGTGSRGAVAVRSGHRRRVRSVA